MRFPKTGITEHNTVAADVKPGETNPKFTKIPVAVLWLRRTAVAGSGNCEGVGSAIVQLIDESSREHSPESLVPD